MGVRVRMYRVGFGDFFLVSLLDEGGQPEHIVIDCGVFKGTSQTGDIGSIQAAVADMVATTGGRVSLIMMTHRHADHIAGFARCADRFKSLTVGGVWMPIWESEYEPTAMRFQAELTRTAYGLARHFTALGAKAAEEYQTARKYMENAIGELDATGAAAASSNAVALDLLKHGFAGVTPRYYKEGDTAELPKELLNLGLTAKILGPPPLSDVALMKLMDLQKGVGQYLAGAAADDLGAVEPFGAEWLMNPEQPPTKRHDVFYQSETFREWVTGHPRTAFGPVTEEEARRARKNLEEALQRSQPVAALTAAKTLNSFLNNQSLVVLFAFKGKRLLFVGDAQAGNWEHWLFNTDTPDKTASGTMAPSAREILTSLDFYKVGHHGSGNATPKTVAATMGASSRRFVALCSTEAGVYGTEDPDDPTKGTEVPREPLLDKLASETALVRSDQIPITVDGRQIKAAVSRAWPDPPRGVRLTQGPVWVDCYL